MVEISPALQEQVERTFATIPPQQSLTNDCLLIAGIGSGALVERILQEYGQDRIFAEECGEDALFSHADWTPRCGVPIWVIEPDASQVETACQRFDWAPAIQIGQLRFFTGPDALASLEREINAPPNYPPGNVVPSPDARITKEGFQKIVDRVNAASERRMRDFAALAQAWQERASQRFPANNRTAHTRYWHERYAPGRRLKIMVRGRQFAGAYLRQCGSSLARSFERLGHEVCYLCESNNFDNLDPVAFQRTVNDFQPDLIVLINSARIYLELIRVCTDGIPLVAWIQDPPALELLLKPETAAEASDLDFIFACDRSWLGRLKDAGYAEAPVVTVPTDPEIFSMEPLPEPEVFDKPLDLSYVASVHEEALQHLFGQPATPQDELQQRIFLDVYNRQAQRLAKHADQMQAEHYQEILFEHLERETKPWLAENRDNPKAVADAIYTLEHKPGPGRVAMRGVPVEWLLESGFDVSLFGHGWRGHPTLGKHFRGMIPYGRHLAALLRASQIHLCVHTHWVVTMKVLDAFATGTFPLVWRMEKKREAIPFDDYYQEDRDIVLYRTREELLDKTRYYLSHPEERQKIALRGREITLQNFTYDHLAAQMLNTVRERFRP